jgi:hypothetical protein
VMIDFLPSKTISSSDRKKIIWFAVFAGLAMLSKYQGAFLWVGALIYILIYNRNWLKEFALYLAGFVTAILLLPILVWNIQNNFISFNYHSDRVIPSWEFRADYFLTEILGQFAYSNPVVYVFVLIALIAAIKKNDFISKDYLKVLLLQTAPLWIVFTSFSVFRSTLPHWSAPALISLIVVAGAYWSSRESYQKAFRWMKGALYFLGVLLLMAVWLINYSPLQLGKKSSLNTFGEDDFTQDLYGWDQVNQAFKKIAAQKERDGVMPIGSGLITYKMFPAAHLDFYVAQPNGRKLYAIGPLNEIHIYAWINEKRAGLELGKDYYHIALSNLYQDPNELFQNYFDKIEPMDTVEITRSGVPVRYALFYKLKKYKGNFVDPLPKR